MLEELKEYVGRYYCEENDQTYTLIMKNDNRYIANFKMMFAEKDKFLTDWAVFGFKRNKNENIIGFTLNAALVRYLWFKRI